MTECIISTFNRPELTAITLSVLRGCIGPDAPITVIDDASTDYTPDDLRTWGATSVLRNETRQGVGKVARQRVVAFLGGKATTGLLMDNDLLVAPGIVERCEALYADAAKIARLPLVLSPYRSTCHTDVKWSCTEEPPRVTLYDCLGTIGGAAMFMDREAAAFLLDYVPPDKWDDGWDWAVCASGVMMIAPPVSWVEHLGRLTPGGVHGVSVDKAVRYAGYERGA